MPIRFSQRDSIIFKTGEFIGPHTFVSFTKLIIFCKELGGIYGCPQAYRVPMNPAKYDIL